MKISPDARPAPPLQAVAFFSDGSVFDLYGRPLFYSTQRFMDEVCSGSRCFLCGAEKGTRPFNDEHIIPNWILQRFSLHQKMVNLPNGAGMKYGRYTVPCCVACNSFLGHSLEEPVSAMFAGGFAGIHKELTEAGLSRLFVWLNLLYFKTHFKDISLRHHLDSRNGTQAIAEAYDWSTLHHVYCVARSVYTGCEVDPCVIGSLLILEARIEGGVEPFDYCDLYNSDAMLVRIGDICVIAVLNDSCAALNVLKGLIEQIPRPVAPLQQRELLARMGYVNMGLVERPRFHTSIAPCTPGRISATVPARLELPLLEPERLGTLMHFLCWPLVRQFDGAENEDLQQKLLSGELTFFIGENT